MEYDPFSYEALEDKYFKELEERQFDIEEEERLEQEAEDYFSALEEYLEEEGE